VGNTDIEDSLVRLDKLTQEEARMASAELLKMTSSIDDKVKGVDGKVQDVCNNVHDVRSDVRDVRSDVHDVDYRMQSIGGNISNRVQAVDDKVEQVNRSSSP
jgi:hypothetical protein